MTKRDRYRDLEQLGLVTNCDGYLSVNLDLFRFGLISLDFFNRNEAQKHHILLDTIFDSTFYFGLLRSHTWFS